jgi:hypothetical protein
MCCMVHLIVAGLVGELIVGTVGDVDALFWTARFGLQSLGEVGLAEISGGWIRLRGHRFLIRTTSASIA